MAQKKKLGAKRLFRSLHSQQDLTHTTSIPGAMEMDEASDGTAPIASDTVFLIGDVVLAFHGSLLYEARVLSVVLEDGEEMETGIKNGSEEPKAKEYVVHYQGWKKSWEETVPSDMVYEHNDENLRVAHHLLNGAKMRQQALHSSPTTDKEKGLDQSLPPASPSLVLFQIPTALQRQLVDDWEFVTKENRLVPLPREHTVESVLNKWVSSKRTNADKVTKEVAEALQTYFDAALSKLLLYRFERQQYVDYFHKTDESPPMPSAVYGPEHLLRLLQKLPYMLESAAVGKDKLAGIAEKVNELSKYLQKHGRSHFLTEYQSAPQSYIDACISLEAADD